MIKKFIFNLKKKYYLWKLDIAVKKLTKAYKQVSIETEKATKFTTEYYEMVEIWAKKFSAFKYSLTQEEKDALNSDEYTWLTEHQNELD